ncbi:MAG: lipopolysaccharide heptosyltransferase II [Vicinamibacterales bacterium]
MKVIVFSPNWLGDAVMALPAVADIRRHPPVQRLAVAARPGVAGLWKIVAGVDEVVVIPHAKGMARWRTLRQNADALRLAAADAAVLLPSSTQTALMARRAGIPERWGYRGNLRGWLLTRALPRPRGVVHQADFYRHLVAGLGIGSGEREPRLEVPSAVVEAARAMLAAAGWTPGTGLLGIAPGAAYGGAKRWPPERFAAVAAGLARAHALRPVLVGAEADRPAACAIEAELGKIACAGVPSPVMNLAGQTDVPQLAGVLALCAAFVSNDSGAMHLAAAVGAPVVALFGPTDERVTAPVARRARVLTADAWCRPCLLRECPLDHRCMNGIDAGTVARAAEEFL